MKYKLLKFNQDWGDEFDIPALACFTEKEFNEWCKFKMTRPNDEYDQEMDEYNIAIQKHKDYMEELNKIRGTLTPDDLSKWITKNYVPSVGSYSEPQKGYSRLSVYLGNYGDGFADDYNSYETGQDFINAKLVEVYDVDKSFYDSFHKANISSISMCNIFDIENLNEDDE